MLIDAVSCWSIAGLVSPALHLAKVGHARRAGVHEVAYGASGAAVILVVALREYVPQDT